MYIKPQSFKFLYALLLLLVVACRPDAPADAIPRPTAPSPGQATNLPTAQAQGRGEEDNLPVDQGSQSSPPIIQSLPPQGGTAILGLIGRPESLNPVTGTDQALSELTPLLFESLLQVDPVTARLRPGLARNWEYTPDGKAVIFQLYPALRWSDRAPLTAAAVAESLKATEHPALEAFSSIASEDDDTLVMTFARLDCAAVTALAQLPLLPANQISQPAPPGSGPFKVTDWSDSKRTLTLVRNPEYHGEPAALDGLIVRFITRQEVAVALSEGQLDAVGPLQAPLLFTPTTMLVDLSYPSARITYLAANFSPRNEEPLEPEVRQALAQALDRQAILAELLGGDGQLLPGSLLPDHWAAGDDLAAPEYDPEAARALLAQAGLRDSDGDGWLDREGRRLELGIRTNGDNLLHQQLAWLASSYYRKLGLFARAEGVPFDSLVDDLFTHDFRLAIFSWPVLVDPDQRLYWHSQEETEGVGLNFTSYSNPSLDNLLERGVSIPGCRPEARAQVYNQVQEILAQDRPVDFLFTPNLHVLVGSRLHGLEPGPFAPFTWNATGWYLQQ